MNVLRLDNSDLVTVDYGDLLDKILEVLQENNPFSISGDRKRLLIDIDEVANQTASCQQVHNSLGDSEFQADSATVNFLPEVEVRFRSQVRDIQACLRHKLEAVLGNSIAIEQFAASLTSPLESFKGKGSELGFKYDFGKCYDGLQKQKLSLECLDSGVDSLLKFHKVTIIVRNADIFQEELKAGLKNYIAENTDNQDYREELNSLLDEMVENQTSDFHRLVRVVDRETLGQLKKEAKITYLEYLLENIDPATENVRGLIYLKDLIRRLRLMEAYISDIDKADGYYSVNYQGTQVNYRDMFSRSEALDALPIIPIIAGSLGETTDDSGGDRQFIFGLKLKFGNPVQSRGGDRVLDYYLNLLNPDSEEHLAALEAPADRESFFRKVLKIAFLYHFVFASSQNPLADNYSQEAELEYDPIAGFERVVLPTLQSSNEPNKKQLFRNFFKRFQEINVTYKINCLKQLLQKFILDRTILPSRTEPRQILIKRGLLENIDKILTTGRFFKEVVGRNPKETLQYISVGKPNINPRAICQLPLNITIEDVRYFPSDESQSFSMEYNIKGIQSLPVIWVPKAERSREVFYKNFHNKSVVFPYDNRRLDSKGGFKPQAAFVYKFAVSLMSYICLQILLDKLPNNLFVPMVRLHEGDSKNPSHSEKFIGHFSKTLCHILSEKHRANSKGFRIRGTPSGLTIRNGLSSLYSILPKKFRFNNVQLSPELDNLAIIAVSTRDSDVRKGGIRDRRKACLIGEITGIRRQEDDSIQVGMLKTFSENYSLQHLYTQPSILADIVSQLYNRGYRNFLYISQAPYMSTLHITQNDEDDRLFFMSKDIIRILKGEREDIRVYPVFFDKYYVHSPQEHRGESFYIQDTAELADLFADSSKQAAVFFNLFNGIKVEQGEKNFYSGVISYSTLLNIYEGILDDQNIREGLIYNGTMKDTLLHYLTIFHFSRYEARQKISLKLDPFDRIIGNDSVGALSEFSHAGGSAIFNSLAFLNKVREVLSVTQTV
ncbi:MAG: hypothetical protein WBA89_28825 [Microcoleus sp.]|uniref:hypothetical protein n=1 Tax=Microcoleus sp. TaxID=44472 RepID=UPI003C73F927